MQATSGTKVRGFKEIGLLASVTACCREPLVS